MRCFIVVVLTVASVGAATAAATASCAMSEEFFARHNSSADDSHEPGPVCGGQCCGRGRETQLGSSLRRVAERRAAASTRPIAELLLSTRRTLQEHLTALSHQSQNKTAVLFAQVYRGHASRAHAPLGTLYEDIRALLRTDSDRDVTGEDLGSPAPRDLDASARRFFRDIFPVAYHNVLRLEAKQFTPEYEECLKDAYDAVQPFGEVPRQLGNSLSRSLEAARALLQVLAVGAGALAASERVLASTDDECTSKLLQAGGCARCRGHSARPCRNYCLNVARGCIGSLVSELDAPWAGYVEGVERLARADADAALRALDSRVSEAIMHALENHVILEKKVRQECGPPTTVDVPSLTSPRPTPGTARRDALRAPPPDAELLQFAASLAASKKLFLTLADKLCDEPDFAHEGNDGCWNGESIGEYTKALAASASLNDQRYNPEVAGGAPQDPRVAALGDRLRQARQLLVSHSWGNTPAAEAFMQGDEAGDEGSGSGGRGYPDDGYEDSDDGSGEGSGLGGPIGGRNFVGEETTNPAPPKTSGVSKTLPTLMTVCAALLTTLGHCLT
ncbi:division abnormally delayed protein isoform X2 [Pectinophora gossypiella]|uniref:division abnormally delayed protein isoform X2 n=1 Tax=Pectinophora gossypiella TaxID=13191 RepID=UPI00214E4FFA|nr:division abnormally delayed protein isoform X2 [Pectinophora gossypiella]